MAISPRQAAIMRGHPTSPGVRDFPGVSATTNLPTPAPGTNLSNPPVLRKIANVDGEPGVPRYVYPLPRDYHADPANLGASPNGPKQPGIVYRGEIPGAGFDPWNSRNAKLRQQTIESAQSGSV